MDKGVLLKLVEISRDCGAADWDGYGAKPVNELTFNFAVGFLYALPSTTAIPDVTAEPDGDIAFDWQNGENRCFSVSINEHGALTCVGMFGSSSTRAVEYFSGHVSNAILGSIKRVFENTRQWIDC